MKEIDWETLPKPESEGCRWKKIGKVESEVRFTLSKPIGNENIVVLEDCNDGSIQEFDSFQKATDYASKKLCHIWI